MKRPSVLGLALVACATVTAAASPEANTQRPAFTSKLVVLDVELSGDLVGPELAPVHQARLNLASAKLRESLSHTGLYQLVDSAPAQSTIRRAEVPLSLSARLQRLRPRHRAATRGGSGTGGMGQPRERSHLVADLRISRRDIGSDHREKIIRLQRGQRYQLDACDRLYGARPGGVGLIVFAAFDNNCLLTCRWQV